MKLPDLPIVTGDTLTPKRLGPDQFYEIIPDLIASIPDLEAVRQRRLQLRRPVPVPFVYEPAEKQ